MDSKFSFPSISIIAIVTFVGFGIMAFLVNGNQIVRFDSPIISIVQNLETPFMTKVMKFFTFVGKGDSIKVLAFISVIVLFFFFKHRSDLLLFIVVLIGSHYLYRSLKLLFHRARPDLHRLIEIGGYSFPSGHATNAITFYGIFTFIVWNHIQTQWGRTLLVLFSSIMVVMIGLSRIYLGVHYPSDVIAGYFAGGFWLILAIWIYRLLKEKMSEQANRHTPYPKNAGG